MRLVSEFDVTSHILDQDQIAKTASAEVLMHTSFRLTCNKPSYLPFSLGYKLQCNRNIILLCVLPLIIVVKLESILKGLVRWFE